MHPLTLLILEPEAQRPSDLLQACLNRLQDPLECSRLRVVLKTPSGAHTCLSEKQTSLITKRIDEGRTVDVTYMDISKAFDKIPLGKLVSKTGDGVTAKESISLKRVAVVEDFFDIIYSTHVETGTETAKTAKHAGQKRTYKAIAETYAFLPREAVTRFLMSCTECQKRMHINPNGVDSKENERPSSLAGVIDYNMPITATYLKQMKLQFMSTPQHLDESSVSSDDFDMSDATWISADQCVNSDLSPSQEERMHSPQNLHNQEYATLMLSILQRRVEFNHIPQREGQCLHGLLADWYLEIYTIKATVEICSKNQA
ncbi:nucleolar protein 4-like [Rhincodon typus]|uniref:nucleolar protein 4-like n=1 Tax=Rhincodon typus TaxID=259920 RepID=UPI00202E5410|nr:nucleolar protein 4-like [Rhincodon typus]